METKWVIEIACNSQSEAERTRDWLAYYSFGPDRVSIVESESEDRPRLTESVKGDLPCQKKPQV